MAPGLSLHIAEKRFGDAAPLFADFSLSVQPGKVLAVLGPSGIGKSTLLRLIAGIDTVFSGSIDAGPLTPGFVFQDARLLPWLTAAENVELARPQGDAVAFLAQVGLRGAEGLYPRQLSGGMQRRVALARALANNAGLLLLDEPFAALDRTLHGEMVELVAQVLDASGSTAVLVSHDAGDAARLADHVMVLYGGPVKIKAELTLPIPRAERTGDNLAHYTRQIVAL